jgi:hypothetical protein
LLCDDDQGTIMLVRVDYFEECQAVGEDDITLSTLEAVKPAQQKPAPGTTKRRLSISSWDFT